MEVKRFEGCQWSFRCGSRCPRGFGPKAWGPDGLAPFFNIPVLLSGGGSLQGAGQGGEGYHA